MTNLKQPLIIISGPTSAGKTALSLKLAKTVGGEIISADSMQVYRHMDIGTAKIKPSEMQGVPHYLIDCLNPDEEFNVSVFRTLAEQAIETIRNNGHIPIVVGGTGFYIQALLKGVTFDEEDRTDGFRLLLEKLSEEPDGEDRLYEMLRKVDPKSCEIIPKQNVKRVIRALEFEHYHDMPISLHNAQNADREPQYNYAYFVLTNDREELYDGIERRVDRMMHEGLLKEVQNLVKLGYSDCTVAMQGLGYKQLLSYLRGECTLEEAVYKIKLETRHFAKRQLTWFRREKDIIMFNKSTMPEEEILRQMLSILKEKAIV